jgi:hypothetical protein
MGTFGLLLSVCSRRREPMLPVTGGIRDRAVRVVLACSAPFGGISGAQPARPSRTTVRSPRKPNHCLSSTPDQYNILTPRLCDGPDGPEVALNWRLPYPILPLTRPPCAVRRAGCTRPSRRSASCSSNTTATSSTRRWTGCTPCPGCSTTVRNPPPPLPLPTAVEPGRQRTLQR